MHAEDATVPGAETVRRCENPATLIVLPAATDLTHLLLEYLDDTPKPPHNVAFFPVRPRATPAMSFNEDEAAVFSAEELLNLDDGQLVGYMKRRACADGGFDISSASGLDMLSRPQRDALCTKLK